MDKKAKWILHKYYWKNGWLKSHERFITEEDYNYAREKGVMFELGYENISHDDCIYKIKELVNKYSKQMTVDLFVSSLSTKNVYNRSILSSYIQAEKVSMHKFAPDEFYCEICKETGLTSTSVIDIDRNVMNFEKSKWGGVRLFHPEYILFDLEQAQNMSVTKPNNKDIEILNNIFSCISNCKENDGPRQLEKNLKDVLPSSKSERDILIEIFSAINILQPKKERPLRGGGSDFGAVEEWRGEDGYNISIAKDLFKEYL